MKLFHNNELIGEISNISREGVWMSGELSLNSRGERLREFFSYMTDDKIGLNEEPPFSSELLDDEMWHIVEGDKVRGIDVPAVHSDGTVEWRWR